MKHSWKITLLLLVMFFTAQLIGLAVIHQYSPNIIQTTSENGTLINQTVYNYPYGLNPPADTDPQANIYSILIAIAFSVVLMLVLMKFHVATLLRYWFFIVVALALGIAINSFIINVPYAPIISLVAALALSFIKIFKRNIIVHNLTELLIYPGIAAILVPLLNLAGVMILLVVISIYDIYAVWHAGFMQKMAKYQIQKVRVFSGFFVPYIMKTGKESKVKPKKGKKVKVSVAILGGGDVVFPIIVSGVILMTSGFLPALIISIGATLALAGLFWLSEKGKFYPAMPFISLGCFAGILVVYLLNLL